MRLPTWRPKTIRELAGRAAPPAVGVVLELAGAAGFLWGLHQAWPPLAGMVGGPLAVIIGMAVGDTTRSDTT